jgi:hypothetical protein
MFIDTPIPHLHFFFSPIRSLVQFGREVTRLFRF